MPVDHCSVVYTQPVSVASVSTDGKTHHVVVASEQMSRLHTPVILAPGSIVWDDPPRWVRVTVHENRDVREVVGWRGVPGVL
jgi:hypothetical protein